MGLFKKEEKVSYTALGHVPMIHRYGKHWIEYDSYVQEVTRGSSLSEKYKKFFKESDDYKLLEETLRKIEIINNCTYSFSEIEAREKELKLLKETGRVFYNKHKELYYLEFRLRVSLLED